ncbi:MAG: DUF885 domain-containing protein, partial [Planctomycetia bacterium]|nr:DUF885 domain-containing protein [Planctomycetia bacterium]
MIAQVILMLNACCFAGDNASDTALDKTFDDLGKRYVQEFPALSPVSATQLGDHRFDGKLDEVSAEARARSAALYRKFQVELAKIDVAKLSRAHQVDYRLLDQSLCGDLWRLEKLQDWAWNPLVYTELAGGAVYGLMSREFAPLPRRLGHVADRLEQFPRLLGQVRETLEIKRIPPIHAETAVKQNRGVLSILSNMVEPHVASLPETDRKRLERAIATAREAVEAQQKWLESEVVPKAAGDFRLGPALFDEKLAFTLHTPLSRDEIRARARHELGRVREVMYQTASDVYKKKHPYTRFPEQPSNEFRQAIIRAGLELAASDVPRPDAVVETAKATLATATEFVRQKDLMTLPDDPLDIIVMPEFQRGVSTAYCDSPGPLDVGQKTFYAVAPLPADWSSQQVTSFLREYNNRSIHNLTVHEAMPGHFVQLAWANRYPSTLRAVLSSGVFVEGWACYTERMMVDEGYLGGDPLMKLVGLKWYLRTIANALLDQAIHVDGMPRDEAMQLMIEDTFQEEREAAGKWIRAQLTSTQLSTYFVGLR